MSTISRRDFIASAAAASAIPLIGASAHAQTDWPTKPIRIIAGYPARLSAKRPQHRKKSKSHNAKTSSRTTK